VSTTYSQEFKDQIVALHRTGRAYADLAKEFNIAPTSIANWVRAADKADADSRRSRSGAAGQEVESDAARIKRLERELARKEQELEVLGKALAFFARRVDQ
jgi:transposase